MPNGGGNYVYQYNLKDHLGNNRVSFYSNSGTPTVVQEDEYYAFGLRRGLYDASNNNRYLYNGKEIQTDLSNQYDYGARLYDPVIGRWTSVDPLAEKMRRHSVYNYGFDDPIRFEDPDGMAPGDSGGGDDPWWGGQHGTGNGNSFIENAYGVMQDGLISGLGTLGSIALTAVRGPGAIPNRISMSYNNDPEGHIVSTPLYTPGSIFKATVDATLDVVGSVPTNPETGGLFSQTTGVKSSLATIVRDSKAILAENKLAGKEGENFLHNVFGGETQVSFNTSQGRRVVDILSPEGKTIESKVGRTSLTKGIKAQIAKDAELIKTPNNGVSSGQWDFFPGLTGSGPTKPLQNALQSVGIPFVNH